MENLETVFSELVLAVQNAGTLAKKSQGKVANKGKNSKQFNEGDSERLKAVKQAKTVIDEEVQEIILSSAKKVFDVQNTIIDAEEKTPSTQLFSSIEETTISLIIDPIDGTLEYLEGKDSYSICVGVINNGKIKLALVFFPSRNTAYGLASDGESYIYKNFETVGTEQAQQVIVPDVVKNDIVYKNNKVSEEIYGNFSEEGYKILDDMENGMCPPDAILKILKGKALCCLFYNCQMRDVLLGAIVGNANGGFMSNWSGEELVWEKSGRVPNSVFGNINYKNTIIKLINQSKL